MDIHIEKKVYLYRRKRKIRVNKKNNLKYNFKQPVNNITIKAPIDFRFIINNNECLDFFSKLRSKEFVSNIKDKIFYSICLKRVSQIDFATITILKTIMDEFALNNLKIQLNLPKDKNCRIKLIECGFLNNVYNEKMELISYKGKSDYISLIRNTSNKLSSELIDKFDEISDKAYKHLYNDVGYLDELIILFKELGTNAIEWSKSYNNLWQIGIYYENNKVIFNVIDLGEGIIESLYRFQRLRFIDFFILRTNLNILTSAYNRKYGSFSQEINRNKGLPFIKNCLVSNYISNLYVCTNNIFLNFERLDNSIEYNYPNCNFKGTFYQWEISLQNKI